MYNPALDAISYREHTPWYKRITDSAKEHLKAANVIGLLAACFALACLLGLPSDQYWNIRIPLYLIVTIWTLIRPRVALYLLPLAIPWGSLDTIAGGLTSADILVALLAASWLLSYTLRPLAARRGIYIRALDYAETTAPRYLLLSMVVFLITMLISMTVALSLMDSIKEIAKWGEVLMILMLGTKYLRTRRQIWTIVVIMCLAGISQAGLGYVQAFLDLGPASFVRDASLRVYGTFAQPNPYAGYINMTLAVVIALMLLGRNWATRIFSACVAIPLAGVEYYSQSKGGWLAISAAVIFIFTLGFPRMRGLLYSIFILIVCITGAYIAGLIPSHLTDPILTKIGVINISFTNPSTDNYANSERVAHWIAGIHMFQNYPLLGVGIGNYQDAYPAYHLGIFVVPLGHAHNYYINIAAEAGVLGLTAFILFLLAIFVAGGRAYRAINKRYQHLQRQLCQPQGALTMIYCRGAHNEVSPEGSDARVATPLSIESSNAIRRFGMLKNDRALAIGLLAALLSVCVHNLVDNLYVHAMTSLFALLLVLLIRLADVS
jgi:O-antigen ligase